jgi:DNA repair photolyase
MRLLSNPPNPWQSHHVEYLEEERRDARLEVYEEQAKSVLSPNESPDVPFRWSVNPYRGCFHACIYCYARPSHQHLGFGAGADFERRIVAKVNAPQVLEAQFQSRAWQGETVTFSGITDCYQPLEAHYGLTRACLQVCARFQNPVNIITKGALIRRDVDVLCDLQRRARVQVFISVPMVDAALARQVEPGASPPARRLEAIRFLAEAGLDVGVAVAPVIPGLTDAQVVDVLEAARDAGASRAFMVMMRLPAEVLPVFEERAAAAFSAQRLQHIRSAVRDVRGGKANDPRFGTRMTGEGPRAEAIGALFQGACRRLGLAVHLEESLAPTPFRRPPTSAQLTLF